MNSKSLLLLALCVALATAATCPGSLTIKAFTNTVTSTGQDVSATVDSGYKLIGGGFQGQLLVRSYPSSSTTWTINSHGVTASVGPAPNTVYAIGLYDPDNCWSVQQIVAGPFSIGNETGSGTAVCPAGTTLVGGGGTTDRYLATNYPDTIRGSATSANQWSASFGSASSSFVGTSSSGLTVYAMCLKATGTGYSAGNFILNAAGSTPFSSRSTNRLQIVGGGYIVNGQYGAATATYNSSGAWESTAQQQSGTSIQSLSIGLSLSGSGSPATTATTAPGAPSSAPRKTCVGQIVTSARSNGGSWKSGNTDYQVYDIVVKNLGECPIIRATYDSIFTGPNRPGVSQKWNIGDSSSGDQILGSELSLFGNSIPSGSSRSGFGVVAYNATGVTYVAKGPTTFCDASCTNSA